MVLEPKKVSNFFRGVASGDDLVKFLKILKIFIIKFYILNIKYSMVPPPFTGGRGDESLMFKSPVGMTL